MWFFQITLITFFTNPAWIPNCVAAFLPDPLEMRKKLLCLLEVGVIAVALILCSIPCWRNVFALKIRLWWWCCRETHVACCAAFKLLWATVSVETEAITHFHWYIKAPCAQTTLVFTATNIYLWLSPWICITQHIQQTFFSLYFWFTYWV